MNASNIYGSQRNEKRLCKIQGKSLEKKGDFPLCVFESNFVKHMH